MFLCHVRSAIAKKAVDKSIVGRDVLRLAIKSGSGGQGLPRYNGVGGNGGSIIVVPRQGITLDSMMNQFVNKEKQVVAEHGLSSTQTQLIGKHGIHKILNVPLGSECVDEMSRQLICRCTMLNQKTVIAYGGQGGCAANQYKGQKGDKLLLGIHMKLQPNFGLIGFPNAGKSTLLKALAPEKRNIKIAPYPFTTVKPQMLNIRFDDFMESNDDRFSLSCADLPGIVEGAAQNRGKGRGFLKHLEYCDILVIVVDVHGFKLSDNINDRFRAPLETIALLNKEVEAYNHRIVKKPTVLVLNKIDIMDGCEKANEISKIASDSNWYKHLPKELQPSLPFCFSEVVPTSAKNQEIGELKTVLLRIYDHLHPVRDLGSDYGVSSAKILF